MVPDSSADAASKAGNLLNTGSFTKKTSQQDLDREDLNRENLDHDEKITVYGGSLEPDVAGRMCEGWKRTVCC